MNFSSVEKIADAVLLEGFMLYPYRPTAIKNRQRWNFGTLYPREYVEGQKPVESFRFITECLFEVDSDAMLDMRIRFLQLAPMGHTAIEDAPPGIDTHATESVGNVTREGWQQGWERSADICDLSLAELMQTPRTFSPKFQIVPKSEVVGKSQEQPSDVSLPVMDVDFTARLGVSATAVENGVYKLRLELENCTALHDAFHCSRNHALLRSFISAHAILGLKGARFVSLLDPPEEFRRAVATCQNEGVFPVLAGDEGALDVMLSSPIILYDYPKTAPESAGDFFDGTEMDEMLALRVLTLTDEEKQEMRSGDDRTRMVLERTEALPQEHLMKLHGAIRGLRPVQEEKA